MGPSAAPIIPIAAASFSVKPIKAANVIVKNIPNCAAPPNKSILGFFSNGPKSIIAPIATKISKGNSSVSIPNLYKTVKAPCIASTPTPTVPTADENGIFAKIQPKPIGSSNTGSYSFAMAK